MAVRDACLVVFPGFQTPFTFMSIECTYTANLSKIRGKIDMTARHVDRIDMHPEYVDFSPFHRHIGKI